MAKDPRKIEKSVAVLKRKHKVVKVLGRVKKGKIEIDRAGLAKFTKQHPDSRIAFIALNAPFKTGALTGSV